MKKAEEQTSAFDDRVRGFNMLAEANLETDRTGIEGLDKQKLIETQGPDISFAKGEEMIFQEAAIEEVKLEGIEEEKTATHAAEKFMEEEKKSPLTEEKMPLSGLASGKKTPLDFSPGKMKRKQ